MTDTKRTDGFKTLIELAGGAIRFEEKTVTPFGFSGGGPVGQTTMRNTAYRTQLPKQLTDITEMSLKVAYEEEVLEDIISQKQVNQEIHVTLGSGRVWAFFGWLEEFIPQEDKEGEQPEAQVKFLASNIDPDDGSEAGPWIIAATTTTTTA